MNDLVLANRATNWQKLKSLVLDSVSSRLRSESTISAWTNSSPGLARSPARLQQSDRQRMARGPRSPRPWLRLDQRADHCRPEAGCGNGRQRAAATGVGRRHRARQERKAERPACRELAISSTGAGAPERAGRRHEQGAARPRDPRGTAGLRTAAVGGGVANAEAHSVTREPLVHRGFGREARQDADGPCADVG